MLCNIYLPIRAVDKRFTEVMFLLTKGRDYRTKLTHQQLYSVACSLTTKSDIRRLGLKLGVKVNRMDTIFCNNNGDITEAAYEILKEWRSGQPDPKMAFTTLRDALTHPDVNLHQVAQEALNIGTGNSVKCLTCCVTFYSKLEFSICLTIGLLGKYADSSHSPFIQILLRYFIF